MAQSPILVLGLGNPQLSDDTVGIHIVQVAQAQLEAAYPHVEFSLNYSNALDLLEECGAREKVIIVDSVYTGTKPPGFFHTWTLHDLNRLNPPISATLHHINLYLALQFNQRCGFSLPKDVVVFAIEGRDFTTFSEMPTFSLNPVVIHAVNTIRNVLDTWTVSIAPEQTRRGML